MGGEIDLSFKDIISRAAFDKRSDLRKYAGKTLSYYRTAQIEKDIRNVIHSMDSFLIFEKINENDDFYQSLIIDLSVMRFVTLFDGEDGMLSEEKSENLKALLRVDYESDLSNVLLKDGNYYFITIKQNERVKQVVGYAPRRSEFSRLISMLLRIINN